MTTLETDSETDRPLYLYAVADESLPTDWRAPGLTEDAEVRVVPIDGTDLRAAVQPVERDVWTGPAAEERLQDIGWVGPRARRHEALVERLDTQFDIFPVRFGTLFSSRRRLESTLSDSRATIASYLREAAEHEEWSVRGVVDRETARTTAEDAADARDASSGTSYLQKRAQSQNGSGGNLEDWLKTKAEELWATLSRRANDGTVRSAVQRTDEDREPTFHWAFWIHETDLEAFRQRADKLNAQLDGSGLDIEVDGPWPGYSFRPELDRSGANRDPE